MIRLTRSCFQCFTLTDSFSDHEFAPEWELDVILRVQLAIFPANWNLGNSALPVYHVLGHTHIVLCEHSLIDPSRAKFEHSLASHA